MVSSQVHAFGRDPDNQMSWEKKGKQSELGANCELFFKKVQDRVAVLAQDSATRIAFENTYAYLKEEKDEQGQRLIVCHTDIKIVSDTAKFRVRVDEQYRWVCFDDVADSFTCAHKWSECEKAKEDALKADDVVDSSIYLRGSLIDGNMCVIKTIYRKK